MKFLILASVLFLTSCCKKERRELAKGELEPEGILELCYYISYDEMERKLSAPNPVGFSLIRGEKWPSQLLREAGIANVENMKMVYDMYEKRLIIQAVRSSHNEVEAKLGVKGRRFR